MTGNVNSDIASAVSAIRILIAEKAGILERVSECKINLASEQSMLNLLLLESRTITNEQYLDASIHACKSGIVAWSASIEAYQQDYEICDSKIEAIIKIHPKANLN